MRVQLRKKTQNYQYKKEGSLILLHIILGVLIVLLRKPAALTYVILYSGFAFYYLLKTKNKKNEVLLICSYLTGMDVFARMTHGLFFSEQIKYLILIFMILGMFYKGFKIKGVYYILYLLLLIPGIYISATNTLSYDAVFRKIIAFNLSGPFCLGFCALYCIDREITFFQLKRILFWMLLPMISMAVFVTFFKVDMSQSFVNTASNFAASGGYGPNQVSVALGVGMFILLVRFLLDSPTLKLKVINGILLAYFIYRGLITFSRGGVLTSLFAAVPFVGLLILYGGNRIKGKMIKYILVMSGVFSLVWGAANMTSNGLLGHRYNNEDAIGRKKADALGGREELMGYELEAFFENPFLGIGVGNNKFFRVEESGIEAASHNEITRLLAEHGLLGILAFLILLLVPLVRFLNYHKNVFAMSFFIFWLLTINHNATRIAMPAFLYGLSVLTLYNEKPSVHRKQVVA
ncbi:O-antigen ligase [Pustulibacterium marinum]|uniref:O-antigen ligase n=1 Tax=Pustulibacterium marinum TaxID=1224947 RepID=A0A1I7HNG6_9FLAO|nr:O-antigen ligase family protein [Pustulibacterium marinum]SFU62119.1 O-antigen ligase [Pustulibacterium marinum]